ncbi:MAG: type I secretion system permease/ATPase, partial [Nanobdellota archaeon]
MNKVIKKAVKYFVLMFLLSIFLNILYLSVPLYVMAVHDKVLFSFSSQSLMALTVGLLIALLFYFITDFAKKYLMLRASGYIDTEIAPECSEQMMSPEKGNNSDYKRGLSDLKLLRDALSDGKVINYFDIPWVIIFFAVLLYINKTICFIAFSGAALSFIIYILFRKYSKDRYVISDMIFDEMRSFMDTAVKKNETVKGLGIWKNISDKYIKDSAQEQKNNIEAEKVKALVSAGINFISLATVTGVFCYGALLFFDDNISSGAMFGAFIITGRIFLPIEKIFDSSRESVKAFAALKRLKYYLKQAEAEDKFKLPDPKGELGFEKVVYSLNGKPVLRNINFSLQPGESLVITGPSGSGKSLLAKLCLGIVNPASGKVTVDGADVSQWNREDLGKHTGYLPSEKNLFPGRVDENIAGMSEPDSEKVTEAAKKALAHNIILKFHEGYNTVICEDGANLSSSQSQMVSMARALYDDPRLVVMDSPHKDLDDTGLKNFIMTMKALKQSQTTLVVVSDRPSIAVNADKILVLQDGQISM